MDELKKKRDELAKTFGTVRDKWSQDGERFTKDEYAKGVGISFNEHKIKGFKAGFDAAVAFMSLEILECPACETAVLTPRGVNLRDQIQARAEAWQQIAEKLAGDMRDMIENDDAACTRDSRTALAEFKRMKEKE